MPIFTAVSRTPTRRESFVVTPNDIELVIDENRAHVLAQERSLLSRIDASWLWYEFTPYEVGCDELGGEFVLLRDNAANS